MLNTREQMALEFAKTAYGVVFEKLERMDPESAGEVRWDTMKSVLIAEAVDMADRLLNELNKAPKPK